MLNNKERSLVVDLVAKFGEIGDFCFPTEFPAQLFSHWIPSTQILDSKVSSILQHFNLSTNCKIAVQVEQNEAVIWEEEGNIAFLRMDYDPATQVYILSFDTELSNKIFKHKISLWQQLLPWFSWLSLQEFMGLCQLDSKKTWKYT